METKDHYQLAKWLLARKTGLPRGFAAGVCVGSVLPDWNPVTYIRGVRGGHGLHGHHAEIVEGRICQLLDGLKRPLPLDFASGLRIGTALHYLADAFTYPHHAYYSGSLAEHVVYEASLHRTFSEYLTVGGTFPWTHVADFPTYFADMLALYRKCRKDEHTDCRFITEMCALAFETVLHSGEGEEVACQNESPDYDRPVSAVR